MAKRRKEKYIICVDKGKSNNLKDQFFKSHLFFFIYSKSFTKREIIFNDRLQMFEHLDLEQDKIKSTFKL
jgi:hypothetical protein